MGIVKEFKEFALRGNVVDMAVGIIIGAAFGKIVSSMVADVLMPPIGKLMGGVDFSNYFITLSGGDYATLKQAQDAGAATINVGLFLNHVISFIIVAFALFLVIKGMNALKRKQDEGSAEAPPPPRQEMLLEEIRDLLAKKS